MPYKDEEKRLSYSREYSSRLRSRERTKAWLAKRREAKLCLYCASPVLVGGTKCDSCKELDRVRKAALKLNVLTFYSPNHRLGCSWKDCSVTDIDMLSLDHINNDGHQEKHKGSYIYIKVKNLGFPGGFQTLCYNHQMKKELERVRSLYGGK